MPSTTRSTALERFAARAHEPGVAFLDGGSRSSAAPLSHLVSRPRRELRIDADGGVRVDGGRQPDAEPLEAIDRFLAEESASGRTVIGALAYELCEWTAPEARSQGRGDGPVAVLRGYADVETLAAGEPAAPPPPSRGYELGPLEPLEDRTAYRTAFDRVAEAIRAGEIYQANLSVPFAADFSGSAASLHEHLSATSPVPYGAYLDLGDRQILCNSPELLLARRGDRLRTRPIKGTRPRGGDSAADARLRRELLADGKERAEHLMIVDLERNDLGRLAATGSVGVRGLFTVETYATLHHLETTVEARLAGDPPFSGILRAAFPGGSITGAPKIAAMRVLAALERGARGFYTGAVLHHPPSGDFTMNVAIRTATVRDGRLLYRAGGGLVVDSDPEREYEECMLKAEAFRRAAGPRGRS